jgi:hypothetical protein
MTKTPRYPSIIMGLVVFYVLTTEISFATSYIDLGQINTVNIERSEITKDEEDASALLFADDYVEIVYQRHGHLFSFIPVHFNVRATAYLDGKVEVRSPWYIFLVREEGSELKAEIEEDARVVVQTILEINKRTNSSTDDQTQNL